MKIINFHHSNSGLYRAGFNFPAGLTPGSKYQSHRSVRIFQDDKIRQG